MSYTYTWLRCLIEKTPTDFLKVYSRVFQKPITPRVFILLF